MDELCDRMDSLVQSMEQKKCPTSVIVEAQRISNVLKQFQQRLYISESICYQIQQQPEWESSPILSNMIELWNKKRIE